MRAKGKKWTPTMMISNGATATTRPVATQIVLTAPSATTSPPTVATNWRRVLARGWAVDGALAGKLVAARMTLTLKIISPSAAAATPNSTAMARGVPIKNSDSIAKAALIAISHSEPLAKSTIPLRSITTAP